MTPTEEPHCLTPLDLPLTPTRESTSGRVGLGCPTTLSLMGRLELGVQGSQFPRPETWGHSDSVSPVPPHGKVHSTEEKPVSVKRRLFVPTLEIVGCERRHLSTHRTGTVHIPRTHPVSVVGDALPPFLSNPSS